MGANCEAFGASLVASARPPLGRMPSHVGEKHGQKSTKCALKHMMFIATHDAVDGNDAALRSVGGWGEAGLRRT